MSAELPAHDTQRCSRWRPQCGGGFCSPRKREQAGATPSHWLRSPQITRSRAAGSAARQRRCRGQGRRPPRQGHPSPRFPARSRGPRGRRKERDPGEARRWPSISQERPMLRKGICWPTQPRPKDFFSSFSASIQSTLFTEASHLSNMQI